MLVDGIHDLGGMQGFRAVAHAPAEPVFYHEWEAVAVLCWWPWRRGLGERRRVPAFD